MFPSRLSGYQVNAEFILSALLRTLLLATIIAEIYSCKLWLPNRTFPEVPVIPYPPAFQIILFVLFFAAAFLLLLRPFYLPFLISFLIIEIAIMLGDEMRWQPWLYQYLFIILAVIVNGSNRKAAVNTILFILASTYFFSGLHKINEGFLQTVWQKLILIKFFHLAPRFYYSSAIHYAGFLIPTAEILSGILILLPKQKLTYAFLPIAIHAFVLVLLGPFGIRYNLIVLPWNAAMAIFVYLILVHGQITFSFPALFYKTNIAFAVAWITLPVISWFGYWDRYFSASVYSGNDVILRAYTQAPRALPQPLQQYLHHSLTGCQGIHTYLSIEQWSMTELKVPPPPEIRILTSIEASLAERYPDAHFVFDLK